MVAPVTQAMDNVTMLVTKDIWIPEVREIGNVLSKDSKQCTPGSGDKISYAAIE